MKMSETITKIAPALLKAQKEIGGAKKGAVNPFFHSTYADLGSVMEACKEALNNAGILVLQPVAENSVYTLLLHESGEWMQDGGTPIVAKESDNPQAMGSAVTYAKRYGLQAMVFIPSEDDDGNNAAKPTPVKSTPGSQAVMNRAPVSGDTKICSIHGVAMSKHKNAKGEWYSHRLEDGSWCNDKPAESQAKQVASVLIDGVEEDDNGYGASVADEIPF